METAEGFFYGLYMDPDLLRSLGFNPSAPRIAAVESYALDLHGAAKIMPRQGGIVWGTLIKLPKADLAAMYSFETTKQYQPERIQVKTIDGEIVDATCYNLPRNEQASFNSEYLEKLLVITRKLGLPGDYIASLENLRDQ